MSRNTVKDSKQHYGIFYLTYSIHSVLITHKIIIKDTIKYSPEFIIQVVYNRNSNKPNINNKRQNPANPKTATTKQKTHNRHALYG